MKTVIFDLGGVLVDWDPQNLYKKVFKTQEEVDWFLNNVCTPEWNIEQDGGRTIKEAVALKIIEFPDYKEYIELFYERWEEMFAGIIEDNVAIQQKLLQGYCSFGNESLRDSEIALFQKRLENKFLPT